MFKDHTSRKVVAVLTIFLMSGVGAISAFSADPSNYQSASFSDSNYNSRTENNPTSLHTQLSMEADSIPRILHYETMELRDQALMQLDPSLVSYVFENMPFISTYEVPTDVIPRAGLVQAVRDLKVYSRTSTISQLPNLAAEVSTGITLGETAQIVGVKQLQDMGLTGEGIKIAIVDSGVNGSLSAFIENGISRVENYYIRPEYEGATMSIHGTHVAGIVGGNGIYRVHGQLKQYDSVGMAPRSQIISIQALDENGFGPISDIVAGIDLAISLDVDIISLSLSSEYYNGSDGSIINDIQEIAVNTAVSHGIILVAAAGNLGPFGSGIGIPGTVANAIAVGAAEITENGLVIMWPNSGVGPRVNGYPGPDVIAPGSSIISVGLAENEISVLSGTSMATPHVSGGIALLKQAFPEATVHQIREAISASAHDIFTPIELQGRGLVDFAHAYEILSRTTVNTTAQESFDMAVSPRTIQDSNFVFRHQVIGTTKSQSFFIHSSRNITIIPQIDDDWNYGYDFSVPSEINLVEGLNQIYINSTINTSSVEYISARVYFKDKDSGSLLPNANITYYSLAKIHRSNILFDASIDRDTPVGYFGGHSSIGQFSLFASYLESEGHQVHSNFNDAITPDLLLDQDVLIIPDPDIAYSQSEIDAIREFVYVDGKSILVIANGGGLSAESDLYETFNDDSLESILDGSGIGFESSNAGNIAADINKCIYEGGDVFSRINFCYSYAQTSKDQSVLPKLLSFPHHGPALQVKSGTNNHIEKIAFINDKAVVLGSDLSENSGRILLFSSSLNFDNKALRYGYSNENSHETTDNKHIIRSSVDWLLASRSIQVQYYVDTGKVGEETSVNLHKEINFAIKILDPSGNDFLISDASLSIQLLLPIYSDSGSFLWYDFGIIQANKVGSHFEFRYKFSQYGTYEFYIDVKDPDGNLLTSDGHLSISANLAFFEDQDDIYSLAMYMFFALTFSWILFLVNEGGRKKSFKKVNSS